MSLLQIRAQQSNLFFAAARLCTHYLKIGDAENAEKAFWEAAGYAWTEEDFYWNEWAGLIIQEFCKPTNRTLAIFGAKQSGKSTTVMALAIIIFYGAWKNCSIIYRTTTLNEAEQRGWGEFQRLHEAANDKLSLPGFLLRSKPPKLLTAKGSADKKRIVTCIPVKDRSESSNKSELAGIKGFHTEFQIVIDDELNELPEGSQDCRAALEADWKFFRYIGIGNPNGWDNPLGVIARPVQVLPPQEGATQPTYVELPVEKLYSREASYTWAIRGGTAIRLDARNSPNIIRGRKPDGTWPYKHLPVPASLELQLTNCNGDANHILMWQYIYALPPPDGTKATILSRPLVRTYRGDVRPEWRNTPTYMAGLDPAFTEKGDPCILRFARHGLTLDNIWRVEILDAVQIPILAAQEREAFHIIAEAVIKICKERGIQPWNFSFDCSGTGQGMRSVFYRSWDSRVHEVDSTGMPSKRVVRVGKDIKKPEIAKDVYDRRSSEVAYMVRLYLEAGQLCGLDGANDCIVQEGSERMQRNNRGKIEVISKTETYHGRKRHKSSNHLDAVAVICDNLAEQGYIPGTGWNDARQLSDKIRESHTSQSLVSAQDIEMQKVNPRPDMSALIALEKALQSRGGIPETVTAGSAVDEEIGIAGY